MREGTYRGCKGLGFGKTCCVTSILYACAGWLLDGSRNGRGCRASRVLFIAPAGLEGLLECLVMSKRREVESLAQQQPVSHSAEADQSSTFRLISLTVTYAYVVTRD